MSDKDHTDKDIQIDYEILRQFEEYFDPQIENDDEDRMYIEGIENLTPKEELRVLNNYDEENTIEGGLRKISLKRKIDGTKLRTQWDQFCEKTEKGRIEDLFEKVIRHSYEVREVDYEKKSKRKRIEKSLLMMDDLESFNLWTQIKKCQSHNKKRFKEDKKNKGWGLPNPLNLRSNEEVSYNEHYKSEYLRKYTNHKKVCQSLWCPNCRKVVSKVYEKKIRDHISERLFPKDVPYQNKDFNHLSGVVGVCGVNFDEVQKLIKKDEILWKRIRRNVGKLHFKYSPFIESVYELELVNWRHLQSSYQSDFKKKQIGQLIKHFRPKSNLMLFVHFHSITNLSKDQIDDVFKDYYFIGDQPLIKTNKNNGLYVQSFKNTQSLDRNLEKLCSYPFKDPHRFKHSFRGSDHSNGEYFEYEELSLLMKVYQRFQKRSWRGLFRSVEHPLSKDLLKWKKLFPHYHNVWRDFLPSVFDDHRGLTPTFVVTSEGDVCTEGWNPNNFFGEDGLRINTKIKERTVIGREYFQHPIYWWITIYKNKYEYSDRDTYRNISLEEFYHSPKYSKLKRDEYIDWYDTQFGRYYQKFVRDLYMRDPKYPYIDIVTNYDHLRRLTYDVGSEFNKNNLLDRLYTILRLDETERLNYCEYLTTKNKPNSKKKILTKKEFKDPNFDSVKWVTNYVLSEIEKLEGRHNLQKFTEDQSIDGDLRVKQNLSLIEREIRIRNRNNSNQQNVSSEDDESVDEIWEKFRRWSDNEFGYDDLKDEINEYQKMDFETLEKRKDKLNRLIETENKTTIN